jgi:hypothetical protein
MKERQAFGSWDLGTTAVGGGRGNVSTIGNHKISVRHMILSDMDNGNTDPFLLPNEESLPPIRSTRG